MRYLLAVLMVFSAALARAGEGNPVVEFHTNQGSFTLELFADKAPQTVANFMRYVHEGFYEGTIFHRVVADYMIQGGGYTANYRKKTTHGPIQSEAGNGLKNKRGTIAMARLGDPHSATAQFFINTADNNALDHKGDTRKGWGYTVFGKVTKGMDAIDQIQDIETGPGGPFRSYLPQEAITINKIDIVRDLAGAAAAPAKTPAAKSAAAEADVSAEEDAEADVAADDEADMADDDADAAADDEADMADDDTDVAADDEADMADDDADVAEDDSDTKTVAAAAKPAATGKPGTAKPAAVKPVVDPNALYEPEPPDVPAVP